MLFSQYVEMEVVPALTFVRCMQGGRYNKTHSLTTSLHSLPVIILPMMQMGQRRGEGVYGTYQDKSPRMFPNPPSYMGYPPPPCIGWTVGYRSQYRTGHVRVNIRVSVI